MREVSCPSRTYFLQGRRCHVRPRWRTCHRRPPSQSAKVAAHRSRRVAFRFHRVETLGLGPGIASVFISLCQPRHRKHVDRRRHRSALYLKRPLSRRRRPAATVFHADDPVNLSRLPACVNIFWTASKKREPCKQRKGGRNRERERETERESCVRVWPRWETVAVGGVTCFA